LFVCLFVCMYLCSVCPAKLLGRSRPNLTHALMSSQGVSVKVNVKVIHVCVREWQNNETPESDTWWTVLKLCPEDGAGDTWRMITLCTKLGWRKFRRRISEFTATLAEFSPAMILLDRRQLFCQYRAYENAATAENWPWPCTNCQFGAINTCTQFTYAPSPSSFSILTSTDLTQQIIPAQSAFGSVMYLFVSFFLL